MNVNATPFVPRGYVQPQQQPVFYYPQFFGNGNGYYFQQPMVLYVPVTIYPPQTVYYDPYFNNQNCFQAQEEPHGLSMDELQRMETLDYLSQQKEWTPLWSELFDLAKKETEERDLKNFFREEDRRKSHVRRLCEMRNLLHPIPEKEIMIDVSVLERQVNPDWFNSPETTRP